MLFDELIEEIKSLINIKQFGLEFISKDDVLEILIEYKKQYIEEKTKGVPS